MSKKKLAVIFTMLFAVSLLICIGFRVISDNRKLDYQEVEVRILSGSQSRGKTSVDTDIIVYYNGEEYELNGVTSIWEYSIGQTITAYMSNGKLYEDVSDIRGASGMFMISFIFMWISIILFVTMLTFWIEYKKQKKNQLKEGL